jgi:hypothetical protein
LDDRILSDIADLSIVVTCILDILSPELHKIIQEPMETAHQAWLILEAKFLGNHESRVLQLDVRFHVFK